MSGEIAKLRYLALPRWTAGSVFAITLIVGAALLVFPPGKTERFITTPAFTLGMVFGIAAIVFGVWSASIEFSSGTLQRTLTAEPIRSRVLGAKLACVLLGTAIVGLGAAAAGAGLAEIAASNAGVSVDDGELAKQLFSQVPSALAFAAVGFGFGLLTRSMGGGITLALALAYIADGIIGFIPGFDNVGFGILSHDLTSGLSGAGETSNAVGAAALGTLVWVVIVMVPGWLRFTRGDLK